MFTWLLAVALGHPLVLPPEEDPADWRSVLELVGLQGSAAAEPGAGVTVTVSAEGWQVRAVGSTGEVRVATVAPPTTPADREALAQLAASLMEELEAPALPPLPPIPVPAPAPTPRPSRVREAATAAPRPLATPVRGPEPAAVVPKASPAEAPSLPDPAATPGMEPGPVVGPAAEPAPEGVEAVPSAVEEVSEPFDTAEIREPAKLAPFVWGSVGLHLRSTVLPALAVGAWSGAETRWLRLGAGVEGTAPAGLTELQVEARVQRWSAWGGAWIRLGPVEPGIVGGGQLHRYVDLGGVDGVWVPTAGLSLALFPARPLRLEGRLHRDLRRVDVFVGSDRLQVAEPWSAQIGFAWVPVTSR